jgi:hypothetical protein
MQANNITGTSGQTTVFIMTLAIVSDGAGTPVVGMGSAQPTAAATPWRGHWPRLERVRAARSSHSSQVPGVVSLPAAYRSQWLTSRKIAVE